MTLKKIGTVTITEDRVLVEHFHIVRCDEFGSAAIETLQWAQGRLAEVIVEEEEALAQRKLIAARN